jgi:sugar O-acyltransferase (sialic acid O-acetyltransferase NeuD family)
MLRKILIYGAGGTGRTLAFFLSVDKNADTVWKVDGFIDDTMPHLWGKRLDDIPILGGYGYLDKYSGNIAVAIANDPVAKRNLILKLKMNENIKFPVVTSSNVLISPYAELGEGCIVAYAFTLINPGAKIGDFVIILDRTGIGDDVTIGDYTTLFADINVGVGAFIGSGCVIGSGVTILPGRKIGDGSTIGAGSVVSKDIPSKAIAFGNPAVVIKER